MALPAFSDPSVRPRFLHRDGAESDAPREWEPATMLLLGIDPAGWADVGVMVQGRAVAVRLERAAGKIYVCASWERAGAGTWRVELQAGDVAANHIVQVFTRKLSCDQLETLVYDLEERLPASVVLGLDRLGAFARLHWTPPASATLAQELEHVRRALQGADGLPGLAAVLHEIARQPHHVLASRERWVRLEAARRPVPSRLAAALARSGNLLQATLPARVVDGQVEASFDIYENRLVREFSDQVDRRLRTLQRAAARLPSFAAAHGPLLVRMRQSLRDAWQTAMFLSNVGAMGAAPDRVTQVLLRRPAYRAALEGYIRFRRSARVRLDHPAMDAAIQEVPALYEAWGTLLVLTELLAAAESGGWEVTSQRIVVPGAVEPLVCVLGGGAVLVLRRGSSTATLHIQRAFTRSGSDLRSISFEQRPDLVLEVQKEGSGRALHLFDPKYKLAGANGCEFTPTKEDVDKMHAYRDAIRDITGARVVRSADILYPGSDCMFEDGIGALGALPGSAADAVRARLASALARQV